MVSGNFHHEQALESAGFQRRNVLSYIDLLHGLGEAADTPPAGLLPVAEGPGKEDRFVSWGRTAAGARMPPEDRDLAFRLFKVRPRSPAARQRAARPEERKRRRWCFCLSRWAERGMLAFAVLNSPQLLSPPPLVGLVVHTQIRYQYWPKLGLRVGGGWNNLSAGAGRRQGPECLPKTVTLPSGSSRYAPAHQPLVNVRPGRKRGSGVAGVFVSRVGRSAACSPSPCSTLLSY